MNISFENFLIEIIIIKSAYEYLCLKKNYDMKFDTFYYSIKNKILNKFH